MLNIYNNAMTDSKFKIKIVDNAQKPFRLVGNQDDGVKGIFPKSEEPTHYLLNLSANETPICFDIKIGKFKGNIVVGAFQNSTIDRLSGMTNHPLVFIPNRLNVADQFNPEDRINGYIEIDVYEYEFKQRFPEFNVLRGGVESFSKSLTFGGGFSAQSSKPSNTSYRDIEGERKQYIAKIWIKLEETELLEYFIDNPSTPVYTTGKPK